MTTQNHNWTKRISRRARLVAPIVGLALAAAACGSGESVPLSAAGAAEAPAAEATEELASAAPGAVSATIGSSELGGIIAGDNGLTLYGFTNDVDAASTCYGTCADAWPPVIVDADFAVAPGLDVGIFATTVREDGTQQLVAGKWPLYFFAGDANPGDLAGQGSGDVWFALALDGSLLTNDAGAPAEVEPTDAIVGNADSDPGAILVNADGLSLYGFTNDVEGVPSCYDACADAWPPVIVGSAELPQGLDSDVFSTVERTDGTLQLVAGKWPLYLFAGDAAPGDINGQGSGDVWFLADPTGGLLNGDSTADTEGNAMGSDY